MAESDSFRSFLADQLAGVPELRTRRMFGGTGYYSGEKFFALSWGGQLYLKTDATTRGEFEAAGMRCFQPNEKVALRNYYAVPAAVLEDALTLQEWAERAIAVAE